VLRERGKGGGKGDGRVERTLEGRCGIGRQGKLKRNGERSERRGWEFEEVDDIRQLLFSPNCAALKEFKVSQLGLISYMPDSALDPPPSDVNSSRDEFVGEKIEKQQEDSAVEGDVPTEIRTKSPVDNEHRHTIGGKRYSMVSYKFLAILLLIPFIPNPHPPTQTPLMSNLTLDIDQTSDASLSVSEEGEHEDSDEEAYSDSVKR
jgi:hypothetical protein